MLLQKFCCERIQSKKALGYLPQEFKEIIDKFYNGNRDEKTLEILKNSNN